MVAFFAARSIPTPTHAHALLAVALLVACLPALIFCASAIARMRPRRGIEWVEGVCGRCGYSLHGLPGTICPECGADTSISETRRPTRSLVPGTWIAGALWIALLLGLNLFFRVEIERYMLRLFWHEGSFSMTMLLRDPTRVARLASLRHASLVTLIVVGMTIIIWLSRRRTARTALR
jgi:hypothetical protein